MVESDDKQQQIEEVREEARSVCAILANKKSEVTIPQVAG
jgi:hypothetical protein